MRDAHLSNLLFGRISATTGLPRVNQIAPKVLFWRGIASNSPDLQGRYIKAMSNRRDFLKAGLVAAGTMPGARAAASRPNIVLIMTDQQRAGLTRGSGFPLDTMPTLDRLATNGVGFDRAYATAPVCCPSRVSMLTSRWPHAHRVRENGGLKHATYAKDIVDVFRPQGYRVGLAGKNHSHIQPQHLDFCRQYSHAGGWMPPDAPRQYAEFEKWLGSLHFHISLEPAPFPAEVQHPHRIVSDAAEFIEGAGQNPFLLWVSFPEPHPPYQVSRPYFDLFPPESVPERAAAPETLVRRNYKWRWMREAMDAAYPGYDAQWRRYRSVYLGALRMIDDQIARLVRLLEQRRLAENTIVVFVADHGDYFAEYGLWRKGVGMPETLIRIPMVWSGWNIAPSRGNPAHVSIADVMPTLCEAAGLEVPLGVQGRSLWPMLQGKTYPREEFRSIYAEVGFGGISYEESDHVPYSVATRKTSDGGILVDTLNSCTQSGYLKMVRMGDWKLLLDELGRGELYNLAQDPYELQNRFGDPAVLAEQAHLLQELMQWGIRTEDSLPSAVYKAKWPARNWYASYRHA